MKKTFLGLILGILTISTVHAQQQTIVIERPGVFTDLAEAATALVTLPAAAAVGIVEGTVEAVRDVVLGGTTVVVTPAPRPVVVTPAPVVVQPAQVVTTVPVVVAPRPVVVAPAPTTTIVTDYGNGTTVTVTRPASGYELSGPVLAPVSVRNRVGSSPHVNPYVYRYR